MSAVPGRGAAFLRLFLLQGAWTYERMHGIGMAFAAEPLLRGAFGGDEPRRRAALARAAECFNCHPVLAGVALGASVRAEADGVPPEQIRRLKAALQGPLGALGDRFFWAGVVPALAAAGVILAALGLPLAGVVVLVLGYGVVRVRAQQWALEAGLAEGMGVSARLAGSWLPRWATAVAGPAAFVVGLAVPLAARALVGALPAPAHGVALGAFVAAALLVWRRPADCPPIRVALVGGALLLAALLLWPGGAA
ncbi:MAG: PTS system mannose/fructose/sorbose family transporter subunit IID [Gemmatimonadales bacterium]|nr:PTS system mannose/fructose/sorbose family transporter subunit IID [Gemmatimonadales bacterium]